VNRRRAHRARQEGKCHLVGGSLTLSYNRSQRHALPTLQCLKDSLGNFCKLAQFHVDIYIDTSAAQSNTIGPAVCIEDIVRKARLTFGQSLACMLYDAPLQRPAPDGADKAPVGPYEHARPTMAWGGSAYAYQGTSAAVWLVVVVSRARRAISLNMVTPAFGIRSHAVGLIFWFRRKRLPGSYLSLTFCSRRYFSSP